MIKLNLDQELGDECMAEIQDHLKDDPLTLEMVMNMLALNAGMHHIFDKLQEFSKRLDRIERILKHQ